MIRGHLKNPQTGWLRISPARFILLVVAAITSVIFLTWIQTPLKGDMEVQFAAARQAEYHGNFPLNVYRAWEIKPLGHRALIYAVYKGATLFSDFDDKPDFERAVKVVWGLFVGLIAAFFVLGVRRFITEANLSPPLVFFTILLSFFTLSYDSALEAEGMSLLFLLVALPLALAQTRFLNVLSGLPLAALFTLKGITVLLAFPVLIILFASGPNYRKNVLWTGAGLAGWLAVMAVIFFTAFPQELRDLRNATFFQNSFAFSPQRLVNLPLKFWSLIEQNPILVPGIVFAWVTLPILVWEKKVTDMLAFIGILAVSAAIVIIQGQFFPYHYTVFLFPAGVAIFMLHRISSEVTSLIYGKMRFLAGWSLGLIGLLTLVLYLDRQTLTFPPLRVALYNLAILSGAFLIVLVWLYVRQKRTVSLPLHGTVLVGLVVLLMGVMWVRYDSPWGLHRSDSYDDWYKRWNVNRQVFGELDERYRLSQQSQLLFLSPGNGLPAYYFDAPSHCRHFYMIPISRADRPGLEKLRQTSVYREAVDCVLSYDGEYILMGYGWASAGGIGIREIDEKIASEYRRVAESSDTLPNISVYRRQSGSNSPGEPLRPP